MNLSLSERRLKYYWFSTSPLEHSVAYISRDIVITLLMSTQMQ